MKATSFRVCGYPGGDYSLPKMDENEGALLWVPQSETGSVSSSGTTTPPPAPKPMKRVPR